MWSMNWRWRVLGDVKCWLATVLSKPINQPQMYGK